MSTNRKFNLVSGIPCEVTEMTGKHLRIMTQGSNMRTGAGIATVLEDCIVLIGGKKPTPADIKTMLAADRKKALVEIRQFSLDHDPNFKFDYEWVDEDGIKEKIEYELDITTLQEQEENEIPEFPETSYKKINEKGEYEEQSWETLEQVDKLCYTTLPKSGQKVRFQYLDGTAEEAATNLKTKDMNVNSAMALRNPVYLDKTGAGDGVWIRLDLDRLGLKDIGHLRTVMNMCEGKVDTIAVISHPKDESRTARVDLVKQPSFFCMPEGI